MSSQTQQQGRVAAPALTPEGGAVVDQLVDAHGFGAEAVTRLLAALHRGNGRQAQFDHPELGGMGQWSRGGMMMIGDMFNDALKARVAALATDAAARMSGPPFFERDSRSGDSEWPKELGTPAATGSQNDTRYAFFPGKRRLALVTRGEMALYDTGDHRILGFAQQQGGDDAVCFTSQHGTVSVNALKRVRTGREAPAPDAEGEFGASRDAEANADSEGGIFAKIDGIARLHAKGLLSDEEFSTKKAELLARL